MACYSPLKGYRGREKGTNGKRLIVFNSKDAFSDLRVELPCGQCIGCRLERSRQWAIRCMHEASLHEENCFVTLTYDNDNLPDSLKKEHVQKFLKRLRSKYKGKKIRFYMCGEYGEQLSRPHYHLILFGLDFEDKVKFSVRKDYTIYRSETLEKLWTFGFSSIGSVSFESCAYVARYIMKKVLGKGSKEYYKDKTPEYTSMSRGGRGKGQGGIAKEWIMKNMNDIYRFDAVVVRGMECQPAKYYDKIFDLTYPKKFEKVRVNRIKKGGGGLWGTSLDEDIGEKSPERRKVKEVCALDKLKTLTRELEGDI